MPDVPIPGDLLDLVQSDERARWIVDDCLHSFVGRVDPAAGFVLAFADETEADAFRRRWLDA